MIRYLKNRLHAYIHGVIAEQIDSIAAYTVSRMDTLDLASKVQLQMDLEPIVEQTIDRVKTGHTLEYESLAECIDISELALQFDTADIAGEVDYAMVAQYVCLSTLAENFDVEEIASHVDLDYKCLAAAILKELRPVEVRPSA